MRRLAVLVVLGLLVAGCASPAGVPDPTSPPVPVAATTAASSAPPTAAPTPTTTATPGVARVRAEVISVTDGDTIRVRIDGQSVPVRYIGIDTPETVDPRQDVQCFGREASAFNAKLVAGKVVELEKDVSETDRFQRLLRYVYVDGKMVNEELVRGGFARSSSYPPDVKYQAQFQALEDEARTQNIGLWAANACSIATAAPSPAVTFLAPTLAPTTSPTASPVRTVSPTPAPTTRTAAPTPAPTAAPATTNPRANCDAAYPTVCIPPAPPDLDCGDIPYRRFQVLPPDPHRFDGNDKDGIGCES